jgi:hypothetical protein
MAPARATMKEEPFGFACAGGSGVAIGYPQAECSPRSTVARRFSTPSAAWRTSDGSLPQSGAQPERCDTTRSTQPAAGGVL